MNIKSIILVLIITTFISCSDISEKKSETREWKHKVMVDEVIQTSSYTYLLVSEDGMSYWIAVSQMTANVQDVLYFNSGLEMLNFESKELQRTFDKLLLVQVVSDGSSEVSPRSMQTKQPLVNNKPVSSGNEQDMGVVSLPELFNNSVNYGGKRVTVSGSVVKFNPGIMGRNWVHIVDGESSFDLTITTNDNVKLDDKVTFEGVITLNKDFGAGYKYPIIMEEGNLK